MLDQPSPSGGEAAEFIEWQTEIAAFAAIDRLAPAPAGAVLFAGSSSIRLWHTLAADFPELPTINRGFGGSEIADSAYFAEQLIGPYHPRAIVMYAGGNDLADGKSPGQCATRSAHSSTRRTIGRGGCRWPTSPSSPISHGAGNCRRSARPTR
ncbi:hypothetical protein [Frateuria terrea]|uniref:hypothetical protein n=1 Tax=Frateuria terrea TaxID=529704 RepID=UPI001FE031AE|nr:hypothetical protein [Frateuria terrea]